MSRSWKSHACSTDVWISYFGEELQPAVFGNKWVYAKVFFKGGVIIDINLCSTKFELIMDPSKDFIGK